MNLLGMLRGRRARQRRLRAIIAMKLDLDGRMAMHKHGGSWCVNEGCTR